MSSTRQQIAIFPDLPRDKKVIDSKGELNPEWELYFQQLTQALQTNYKPEGIVVPPQLASNIALLGNTSGSIGNIIYDSTNNEFKGIIFQSFGPGGSVVTSTKTFTIT
jgi:hypothetical protein